MTSKLDPQLAFLSERGAQSLADRTAMLRFGLEVTEGEAAPAARRGRAPQPPVQVLVQYAGDTEPLEKAGLRIRSVNGDVISGVIAVERLAPRPRSPKWNGWRRRGSCSPISTSAWSSVAPISSMSARPGGAARA